MYDFAIKAVKGKDPENYFNRGNVHLNTEEFDKAHKDFDMAISIDKTSAKLYHAKGLAYQCQAEHLADKAENTLELQDSLIQRAIEAFGDALQCDQSFISSMFH
jgi:tetratricopeptide (TPR) repeat protein